MKRLSASSLRLAEVCPASHALPAVETPETEAQAAGTGRHAFLSALARALSTGVGADDARAQALGAVPSDAAHWTACDGIDVPELLDGLTAVVPDAAYAFDVATGRVRRQAVEGHRQYQVTGDEIPGTLDWTAVQTATGRRLVIDFKGIEENDPADVHLQLHFYALCVARDHDLDALDVAIVYIHPDGSLRWDRAALDFVALDALAERLARVHARVTEARAVVARGETPNFTTGLHCGRCPAMAVCPAMVTMVRAFAVDPPTPETLAPLSEADAGAAWSRLALLDDLLQRAKASLRERALVRGLSLPDGSRLVPCEVERTSVDVDQALPVLAARFGEEQAAAIVERSIALGAVDRLARQLAPGKGQRKAIESLRSELAAAGATRTSSYVQLKLRKPSKLSPGRPESAA